MGEIGCSAEATVGGMRLNVVIVNDDITLILSNESSRPKKLWNTLRIKEHGMIPLVFVQARNQKGETRYYRAHVRGYDDSYLNRQPAKWEVLQPGESFEAKTSISAYVRPTPVSNPSVEENSYRWPTPTHVVIPSVTEVQVHCLVKLGENKEESLKVETPWISRHFPEQMY